jgi:hypothetical protein
MTARVRIIPQAAQVQLIQQHIRLYLLLKHRFGYLYALAADAIPDVLDGPLFIFRIHMV